MIKEVWFIGRVLPSKHWGDFEVLEVLSGRRVLVKFLLTGNIKDVAKNMAHAGNIEDTEAREAGNKRLNYESAQQKAAKIPSGTVFKTNYWGDVVVKSYRGSREIDVEFVNTGNSYTVQKNALETGLVADSKKSRQIEETLRQERDDRSAQLLKIHEYNAKISYINLRVKSAHRRYEQEIRKLQKWIDEVFALYSAKRNHGSYGEYYVIRDCEDTATVRFTLTGYEYTNNRRKVLAGSVRDYSQYSLADEKAEAKARAAQHYLDNREFRLEQAKEWQKANPEKCRVRNRNRRARRVEAEGTHTLDETQELLQSQNCKCNACGVELDDGKHLDHIMPLALGGSNWIENLQWLCQFCNNSKAAKHPDEWNAEIATVAWQQRREARLHFS